MNIHPTAIVDSGAELGIDVEIKAFSIIEAGATIGDGCAVGPNAMIRGGTTIGKNTHIHTGAVLGEPPQDAKYDGATTYLTIGDNNNIREYVTMHRATGEGNSTIMGNGNMLMAYSHVGHNCEIGDNTIIANSAALSGHVIIEDFVNIGGLVGVHQYTTIGTMAMVGGMSRVVRDVPPYVMMVGIPAEPRGLNWRGLSRRGVSEEHRAIMKKAYRLIFRSKHNVSDAIEIILKEFPQIDELNYMCNFLKRVDAGYAGRQANPH